MIISAYGVTDMINWTALEKIGALTPKVAIVPLLSNRNSARANSNSQCCPNLYKTPTISKSGQRKRGYRQGPPRQ
jgi:hypothetical protein